MLKKLLVLLVACAIIAPVFAADWDFYGRSYFRAWFVIPDDKDSKTKKEDNPDEYNYFDFGGDGGRFGLSMKSDLYEGRVEAALSNAPDENKITLRHAWARWNVTETFNVTVGQTYSPTAVFPNNMATAGYWSMLNCGLLYAGRQPLISFGISDFSIALIQPFANKSDEENIDINLQFAGSTEEEAVLGLRLYMLPKIEAAYKHSAEMWNVDVGAGFQMYQLKTSDLIDTFTTTDLDDENILSAVFNADFGINLEKFYGNLAVSGGLNYGAYGCASTANVSSVYQIEKDGSKYKGELIGQTAFGGVVTLGFKVNEFLKPEAGVGYILSSRAAKYWSGTALKDEEGDAALRAYLQLNIMSPEETFTFIPEFGFADEMTGHQGTDEMREIFGGLYIACSF